VWITVPGLLLLYFLTDVLAVPAALAGLTLLLQNLVTVLAPRLPAGLGQVGVLVASLVGGVALDTNSL
jgi:hypothetical protein